MKHGIASILRKLGVLRVAFRGYELLKIGNVRLWYRNLRCLATRSGDGIELPPLKLIVLVAGTADIEWFLEGGRLAYESIQQALDENEVVLSSPAAILDFGCGCGRVACYWQGAANTRFCGADYNAELVHWCEQHLSFGEFGVNDLGPPLTYDDETFDLIYALSVFTHMPADLQDAWMDELARVLKPGGYLLITTHGEHYSSSLPVSERARFASGQLVVRYEEVAGTNLCAAYHPPQYVREHLARSLDIVDFRPEAAHGNPYQDLVLLRKPRPNARSKEVAQIGPA